MDKQQATQILDQAISQMQATRQVHVTLQQALTVLATEPKECADKEVATTESVKDGKATEPVRK